MKIFVFLLALICIFKPATSLWCYQCVSSHPGCGMFDFDWRYYWSHRCNGPNDKCVKVIEQRGADLVVTRDCLSNLEGHRRDIPADHYEGCRSSAPDPILAHYVNTSIKEIDVKRNYYTDVVYCFCDFDERCNGVSSSRVVSYMVIFGSLVIAALQRLF